MTWNKINFLIHLKSTISFVSYTNIKPINTLIFQNYWFKVISILNQIFFSYRIKINKVFKSILIW